MRENYNVSQNNPASIRSVDNELKTVTQENKGHTVTDDTGRVIVIKKPNVLKEFKLIEILGNGLSQNIVYMNMAGALLYIESIDGILVSVNSKLELEALISRLDTVGVNAVIFAVHEHFGVKEKEEVEEKIKK